eukprot:TRINITY_DN74978_c0_g1_i1.p1 TRINITY_DN74978_c0_g1~~TRINITY_DN74978_c0_g1_i1.p1  ORF type:complete len:460 (+),score=55.36 TRINITY_DN74978_c0_g1_i1:88-1380(+)
MTGFPVQSQDMPYPQQMHFQSIAIQQQQQFQEVYQARQELATSSPNRSSGRTPTTTRRESSASQSTPEWSNPNFQQQQMSDYQQQLMNVNQQYYYASSSSSSSSSSSVGATSPSSFGGAVAHRGNVESRQSSLATPTASIRRDLTEEELDVALYQAFVYYAGYGNHSVANREKHVGSAGNTKISGSNYVKMCRDCKIISQNFTSGRVDLVYSEAVQGQHNAMNFEIFCNSLLTLSQKKFKGLSQYDALRKLLVDHILPFTAKYNKVVNPTHAEHLLADTTEALHYVQLYDQMLYMLFDHYKTPDSTFVEVQPFLKLMADFDACPDLLTDQELFECFQHALSIGETPADQQHGCDYEHFLVAIAQCCLMAFANNGNFPSVLDKVHGLLGARMELRNRQKLQARLASAVGSGASPDNVASTAAFPQMQHHGW